MELRASSPASDKRAPSEHGSLGSAVARRFLETRTQGFGPFDIAPGKTRGASDFSRALTTGVLVLYPAFASAAVVIAGLLLSGASGV